MLWLVNQVGLTRGWTLASFWLERNRGGWDHLFCSGCHYTSCRFSCKSRVQAGSLAESQSKTPLFPQLLLHSPLPLKSWCHSSGPSSSHSWPLWPSKPVCGDSTLCGTEISASHPQIHWKWTISFLSCSQQVSSWKSEQISNSHDRAY